MQTTLNLLFWQKKNKINKKGEAPIWIRLTIDGKRTEISTGIFAPPSKWNQRKQQIVGRTSEVQALNNSLANVRTKLLQLHNRLIESDKPVTGASIKELYTGKEQYRQKGILEVYDWHLSRVEALLGKEYTVSTFRKYKAARNHVAAFIKHQFKRNDIQLQELKYSFITDFEFYLKVEANNSTNSIYKVLQRLKTAVGIALKNAWIEKDPFVQHKLKKEQKEITYLSKEELQTLEAKTLASDKLQMVKDLFIFSCYTGLAYNEANSLTPSDISKGIDGEDWIVVNRKKTNKTVKVPLLPKAKEIIDRYKDHPKAENSGKLLPLPSNQKFNAYLKEIAVICNIDKPITHHLARRTFATTVTLLNGVPMETVSKLLGHTNIKVTQDSYAKIVNQKVSEDFKVLKVKLEENRSEVNARKHLVKQA